MVFYMVLLIKELIIAIEVHQQAHVYAMHWSYHVPHHLDMAGLLEHCFLLKTQLQHQLGGSSLEGWVSPEGGIRFETASDVASLLCRINGSRNQG